MGAKIKWENIKSEGFNLNRILQTRRARVLAGWLVTHGEGITFVPDPGHKWQDGVENDAQEDAQEPLMSAPTPIVGEQTPWDDPSGAAQEQEQVQSLKERLDEFRKNGQQRSR